MKTQGVFFIKKTHLNKGKITNKKIKEFQKLEMSCHTFCNLVVNWRIFLYKFIFISVVLKYRS